KLMTSLSETELLRISDELLAWLPEWNFYETQTPVERDRRLRWSFELQTKQAFSFKVYGSGRTYRLSQAQREHLSQLEPGDLLVTTKGKLWACCYDGTHVKFTPEWGEIFALPILVQLKDLLHEQVEVLNQFFGFQLVAEPELVQFQNERVDL